MAFLDIGTLAGRVEISDNIAVATDRASQGFEAIEKRFGGLVGSIAIGSSAIVGSLGAITLGIITLGQRGSDILDVSNTLEQFAGSAAKADEILGGLRTATKGTVTDFDLMKTSSRLLSAGVKLTTDQFETLGSAARVLSNRGLGPTKQQLDLISQAMITGRTRTLAMSLGVIDAGNATQKYADYLGVARSALTRTQEVEANRRHVLDLLNQAVQKAGEQQLSFSEILEKGKVTLINWWDALARGIASSPRVLAAMNSIGDSISKAFGSDGRRAIDVIIAGVEKFAEVAAKAAQFIPTIVNAVKGFWNWLVNLNDQFKITDTVAYVAVKAFDFLRGAFNFVKTAVEGVIAAWQSMPEWLQRIAAQAAIAGVAVTGVGMALNAAATPVLDFAKNVDLGINIVANLGTTMSNLSPLVARLTTNVTLLTLAKKAETIATLSMTAAEGFWAATVTGLANTVPVLTVRIWLLEASEKAAAVSSGLLASAKAYLAGVMTALGSTSVVLAARIWLLEASEKAAAAASGLMAGGLTAARLAAIGLGTALFALNAIPIVALLTAMAFALREVAHAVKDFNNEWNKVGFANAFKNFTMGEKAFDEDNFVRRFLGLSKAAKDMEQTVVPAFDATRAAIDNLAKDLSGQTLAERVMVLGRAWEALTPAQQASAKAMEDAGRQAAALRREGAGLGPIMTRLADAWEAQQAALTKANEAEAARQRAIERSIALENQAAEKARERAKQLEAVNEKIKEAISDFGTLSNPIQQLIKDYTQLGLSQEEIAIKLGISTTAVRRFLTELQRQQQFADDMFKKIDAAITADRNRRIQQNSQALAEQYLIAVDYAEKNLQLTMNSGQLQVRQIELERDARLRALKATADVVGNTMWLQKARTEVEKYYQNLLDVANRTTGTIVQRMEAQGVQTQATLQRLADEALADFKAMEQSGLFTVDELAAAWTRYHDALEKANAGAINGWRRQIDTAMSFANVLNQIGQSVGGGLFGSILGGLGSLIDGWGRAAAAVREYSKQLGGATPAQKIGAIGSGVAGVVSATGTGSTTQRIIGGAVSGAQAGLAIGAVYAPATLGLSLAIGAGAGALVGLFRGASAAKDAAKGIYDEFVKAHGGVTALSDKVKLLGVHGETLMRHLKRASTESAGATKKAIEDMQKALDKLDEDIQRYGLTWPDLLDPAERLKRGTLAARELIQSFERLKIAGFDPAKIVKGMAGDVNAWLSASLKAGNQIPAAMKPILESLIRSGELSEENAKALLGIADDGVPSLDEIRQAAERYGLTLDQLGPKVKQLSINEAANQIVKDWDILTRAGAPAATLIDAFKKSVQGLVTDALKLGLTLPASMQPIIQAMIDAGELTDEFGQKLTDTSRLNFATPITEKIDDLIDAINGMVEGPMKDLVDAFIRWGDAAVEQAARARGAIESIGKAKPRLPDLGIGGNEPEEPEDPGTQDPNEGGGAQPRQPQTVINRTEINVDATNSYFGDREGLKTIADGITQFLPDYVTQRGLDYK